MQSIKLGENFEAFQCDKCKKICKSARGLATHQRTHSGRERETTTSIPQLLTCEFCFKQFKSRNGLSKHRETHTFRSNEPTLESAESEESRVVTAPSTALAPGSSDALWNDDLITHFEEHGDDFFIGDDEEEEALCEALASRACENATKSATCRFENVLIRCKDCGSGFKSVDGYLNHRMRHAMQAAFAQVPSEETVQEQWRALSDVVLSDMIKTELHSTVALEMTRLAASLKEKVQDGSAQSFFFEMCSVLMQCFAGKRDFFLVTKLMEAFQMHVAACAVDNDTRCKLIHSLKSLVCIPPHIAPVFLSAVLRRFATALLAFIIRIIVKGDGGELTDFTKQYVVNSERTNSVEFKNIMHYIGGSNVKSVLRRLLRIKNPSEETEQLLFTIRNNFLITSFSDAPEPELRAWTDAQDRGGLSKITSGTLDFFLALGNIVKDLERADGSILVEDVINEVCATKALLFMWDDIIKQTLSDNESFNLLYAIVLQFCVTWRKGIVTRRLDQYKLSNAVTHSKTSSGGVAFRAQLQ